MADGTSQPLEGHGEVQVYINGNSGESARYGGCDVKIFLRDGVADLGSVHLSRGRLPAMKKIARRHKMDKEALELWATAKKIATEEKQLDDRKQQLRVQANDVAQKLAQKYLLKAGVMEYM